MWSKNWKFHVLLVIALASSSLAIREYRRVNTLSDRLGCTASRLERVMELHASQMADAGTFTGDKMRELMNAINGAYDCAVKGPVAGHAPDAARSFGQYGVLPHK